VGDAWQALLDPAPALGPAGHCPGPLVQPPGPSGGNSQVGGVSVHDFGVRLCKGEVGMYPETVEVLSTLSGLKLKIKV